MTTATAPAELGDSIESFVSAKKRDDKGREIGFIVGFRDNGTDFYTWVQCARSKGRGDFADFGVRQRSKKFTSQAAASSWAYSTAHARIAALK